MDFVEVTASAGGPPTPTATAEPSDEPNDESNVVWVEYKYGQQLGDGQNQESLKVRPLILVCRKPFCDERPQIVGWRRRPVCRSCLGLELHFFRGVRAAKFLVSGKLVYEVLALPPARSVACHAGSQPFVALISN